MRNTNRDWTTITPKTLHQARIGGDIKRSIRTLSIITGKSISDLTEVALRDYVQTNQNQIQEYHLSQCKGIK